MKENKPINSYISLPQFIMLLVVSRVFNDLTYIPFFSKPVEGTAMLYGSLISTALVGLVMLPALILCIKHPGESVLTIAWKSHKFWGYLFTGIYLLFIIVYLIGGLAGFNYFVTNAVYPQASIWIVAITMCGVCFFAAKSGLQGLSRLAGIVFVFFTAGLIFIAIVSLPSMKLLNIKPLIDNPMQSIWSHAVSTASKNSEVIMLILLMPRVRIRNRKKQPIAPVKAACGLLGFSLIFTFTIDFLVSAVLGSLSLTQTFPYFSLTSIVEVNLFQRLDAVHMVTWVCVAFIHVTLHAMVASMLLRDMLPGKARKFASFTLFLLTTGVAILLGQRTEWMNFLNKPTYVVSFSLLVLIPLIAFWLAHLNKKKNGGNPNNENKSKDEKEVLRNDAFKGGIGTAPPL